MRGIYRFSLLFVNGRCVGGDLTLSILFISYSTYSGRTKSWFETWFFHNGIGTYWPSASKIESSVSYCSHVPFCIRSYRSNSAVKYDILYSSNGVRFFLQQVFITNLCHIILKVFRLLPYIDFFLDSDVWLKNWL